MFISEGTQSPDFTDHDCVIPAVSVGNVGQLAADLLIQNLKLTRVGYFHDDCFLPVIGNDPFACESRDSKCSLMTAAEVYYCAKRKIVVVQQRSPIIKSKKSQYTEMLFSWITTSKFKEVVILSSVFSDERRDEQLTGTQLRFLFSKNLNERLTDFIEENQWKKLECRQADLPHAASGEAYMPGSGIAKSLHAKCVDKDVSSAILLIFCSEGDNASEAIQLATYLNSWKKWIDLQNLSECSATKSTRGWILPSSWKLLYGSRFNQSLFQ
ncbi:hypothetical protein CAPTEDRAFT_224522 [Capitella teleta]|uniref:Proteasome assembly chaperone 2 n=1 Tax=Capitella teleta TaxID=283909 RepID=R7TTG0_CAPTE|nr:hypothetical protein CAPTEDRAFT_224522 [Capitella teleta]|eukprot:ELT96887.1 hypothetical protein CAPTEDRAFT_224522 [Capitella teleta]